jgi:hypothetical protein
MPSDREKIEILCDLANRNTAPAALEHRLAAARPHWRQLACLAQENNILPQIAKNIARNGLSGLLPDAHADAILSAPRKTAALNLLFVAETQRITAAAAENNIDILPLKGAALIDRVCDIDERHMTDLDFLIRKDRLEEIDTLMSGLGYTHRDSGLTGDFSRDFSGEIKYSASIAGVPIDVEMQWDPSPGPALKNGFSLDADTLWRLTSNSDGRVSFAPGGEILYHIFHLAIRHSFSRLMWLLDLHYIISASPQNWNSLTLLFKDTGLSRTAFHTFKFLHSYFHIDIGGGEILRRRSDAQERTTDNLILKSLAGNKTVKQSGVIPLLLSEKPAKYLFNFIFPPADFLKERYPGIPGPLLRTYRPADMAAKFISNTFKDILPPASKRNTHGK